MGVRSNLGTKMWSKNTRRGNTCLSSSRHNMLLEHVVRQRNGQSVNILLLKQTALSFLSAL